MKTRGIQRQTLQVAVIPIVIMAALLEYYFIYARFADLDTALLERSKMIVHRLASSSEYAVFSGNKVLLQQNIDAALAQKDVARAMVLDDMAKPLIAEMADHADGGRYPRIDKNDISQSFSRDEDTLVLYEPIIPTQIKLDELDHDTGFQRAPKRLIGGALIEISKRRLEIQKNELLLVSLAATLLTLILTMMIALWSARRITRPVLEMGLAIRKISEGHLDARITPRTEVRELNELAVGFNRMAYQLQQDREILENRVAVRTVALVASERESRTLTENSPDLIARYDLGCRRIYANAAYGATVAGGVAALVGKRPTDLPGGPNSAIFESRVSEVITTGNDAQFELQMPGKDGAEYCTHVRLTAERDLTGRITSVLSVERDITELNESRNEINRKEQAKSRFLAAAGHDLRQPLAATNLFIGALKLTELTAEQSQLVQHLGHAMSTFNGLLDSLLNISKLDAGIIKPEFAAINVVEIVNWLEQSFLPLARDSQLGFRLYFPVKYPLFTYSDINLIKSILMNLVSNAIKYTKVGGVMVSFRRSGGNVLFQVWDTGIGMQNEQIDHIFDEFYQIDNPQRDRRNGLGLGLAIAKRAMTLLGGKIECRSREGRGTVFEFKLPLDAISGRASQREEREHMPEENVCELVVSHKQIVVVEDDTLVSQAMISWLEGMGGKVRCFHSAEDALNSPDILNAEIYIADYMLGGKLSGIDFLNRLRERYGKPVNAILMTGDTSPSFMRQAEHCDWRVIYKPIDISKLLSAISVPAV
ncbi:MAG: ATP-binding protein [Gallionella sp.]